MIEETNSSQLDYIDSLEKLQNCLHLVETALGASHFGRYT